MYQVYILWWLRRSQEPDPNNLCDTFTKDPDQNIIEGRKRKREQRQLLMGPSSMAFMPGSASSASSSSPSPMTAGGGYTAMASAASSASPCAGCKFLRRKCQPDCVFAPYFPPDNPQKFAHVHRVFGASNVTKLLNELHPCQREDAVNSLAYEAEMRMRDPVYGCVGIISILQHQLRQLQADLAAARAELAKYHSSATAAGHGLININIPVMAGGLGIGREQLFAVQGREQQQHQMVIHGYDADLASRLGMNGVYDLGLFAGMNASASAGIGQLGVPFLTSSATGGDERQGIRPS